MLAAWADRAYNTFNNEQKDIYKEVIHAVIHHMSLLMFIDGKAGWGKTFLVCAITNRICSMGWIALPTATAAFAAQLYLGGQTTHSAFNVNISLLWLIVIHFTYIPNLGACQWEEWDASIPNQSRWLQVWPYMRSHCNSMGQSSNGKQSSPCMHWGKKLKDHGLPWAIQKQSHSVDGWL